MVPNFYRNIWLSYKFNTMKKWYYFWKRSGPTGGLTESYSLRDPKYEEFINEELEDWASRVGGGFNTSYKYGFKEVKEPPKEWIEKEIESCRNSIKYYSKYLKVLES